MISTKYMSFCFGIIIASFTWSFSVYLYLKLSQKNEIIDPAVLESNTSSNYKNTFFDKNLIKIEELGKNISKFDKKLINFENQFTATFKTDLKNGKKLLQQLRPVPVKASVTIGLDDLGLIKNAKEQKKREEGYKNFAFNIIVSENLSLQRELPDTRHHLCKNITYDEHLPSASIIMCFYNEHYNTLLRSLISIVKRTPKKFLHEIILVNDCSDSKILHKQVEKFISINFKNLVKYYKTEKREGLIRARIFGAKKATGDVLVFLDSHIEVNKVWIQPLLARIRYSRNIVAIPVIDIINADTFQYKASPLVRGGFNWGLHFKWDNLPVDTLKSEEDFIKPIK